MPELTNDRRSLVLSHCNSSPAIRGGRLEPTVLTGRGVSLIGVIEWGDTEPTRGTDIWSGRRSPTAP